jgi:hypothetical protein
MLKLCKGPTPHPNIPAWNVRESKFQKAEAEQPEVSIHMKAEEKIIIFLFTGKPVLEMEI